MKSNAFTSILLGALAISALASLVLCGVYVQKSRELRLLQAKVAMINYRQAVVNQLVVDLVEYSKQTKDSREIKQILASVGIRETAAGATNAPASK